MYHEFLFRPVLHKPPAYRILYLAAFCLLQFFVILPRINPLQPPHAFQEIIHCKDDIILRKPVTFYMKRRHLILPLLQKLQRLRQKTIELIHKQRVSRVIILHERCHPLVVCFMPHLHSFNNDWLFSASQTIFHIITVNEKRKYIIFLYKCIWKTAKPPTAVIRIRVVSKNQWAATLR